MVGMPYASFVMLDAAGLTLLPLLIPAEIAVRITPLPARRRPF